MPQDDGRMPRPHLCKHGKLDRRPNSAQTLISGRTATWWKSEIGGKAA